MSVAEKVLQLKQDFDDVYAAGKAAGGGSGDYYQGYEDGKNSVVDLGKLCEAILFESLNVFGKSEVVLDLDNTTTLYEMFCIATNQPLLQNTTVEHITINCSKPVTSLYRAFYCLYNNDDMLKRITLNVDTSKCTNANNVFVGCKALETIDGTPFDFSSTTVYTQIFRGCTALKEFRIVAKSVKSNFAVQECPNLSTETIQSIIDGLADITGGTAQTLTLHKTVGAKLTDEQKATITAKNWTLVY